MSEYNLLSTLSAGLAPVDAIQDKGEFRALQLEGLIRRVEARQEIRGRYANLFGTVVFFGVYIALIYLQKGDIEQSSMIQVENCIFEHYSGMYMHMLVVNFELKRPNIKTYSS